MKQGDLILATDSERLLGLGYASVMRPGELDSERLSETSALIVDANVGEDEQSRLAALCAAAGIPIMVLPNAEEIIKTRDGKVETAFLKFMRHFHKLAHSTQLAPENYDKMELQTLVDIITTTNSLLKPREVMDSVMTQINGLIACEAWSVLIIDDNDNRSLTFAAAMGPNKDALFSIRIPVGEGIAGWVAEHSQPLIVNDVSKDPRFFGQVDKQFTTHNILCAPLISRGRTIGVIEMINRKDSDGFSEADLELVEVLVNPAAVAIENAFLFLQESCHLEVVNI